MLSDERGSAQGDALGRGRMRFDTATLLEGLGTAVVATDADGVIEYWNPAAERLYGWSAEQVHGCRCVEVFAAPLPPGVQQARSMALESGQTWTGWFVARRKDGSPVPVLVVDTGVYTDDGILDGVLRVCTNISVALRPLLDRSWDAAVILGPDAVVRYASPAVEHLLGWRQADLVGPTSSRSCTRTTATGCSQHAKRSSTVTGRTARSSCGSAAARAGCGARSR